MCKRSVTEMELSFLKWLRGRCKRYCENGQAIQYLQVLRGRGGLIKKKMENV